MVVSGGDGDSGVEGGYQIAPHDAPKHPSRPAVQPAQLTQTRQTSQTGPLDEELVEGGRLAAAAERRLRPQEYEHPVHEQE